MATVSEICTFLKEWAPLTLAEPWDNVGMLLGRHLGGVGRLMTCLTLTRAVAEEAVTKQVQMIVTHHPILFRGIKQITDSTEEGRTILTLAESRIAVYSAHTAYDNASDGVNQQLARSLGLTGIQPLRPSEFLDGLGAGRFGILEHPCERTEFLGRVANAVGARSLEYCWGDSGTTRTVAIACGSAAEFLEVAAHSGCDTFITGEARFHAVLQAQSLGVNLILTGHFASERSGIEQLAQDIAQHFPAVECFASESDQNPLSIYRTILSHPST